MPVEFRCPQCDRLLQVPDSARGQQVRCADCGGVTDIPTLPVQAGLASPDGRPHAPHAAETAASYPVQNPYAAYDAAGAESLAGVDPAYIENAARERTLWPAILLIVVAGLSLLYLLMVLIVGIATDWEDTRIGLEQLELTPEIQTVWILGVLAVSSLIYSVALAGGIAMLTRRFYPATIISSVLIMLPCSLCCLAGLPLGIWCLVVLREPMVIAAFRQRHQKSAASAQPGSGAP